MQSNPAETLPQRFAQGAQLGAQISQFNTDAAMKQKQIALGKEEADRRYQLDMQTLANDTAMKRQAMDLQVQTAARKFKAQQGYQNTVQQLIQSGMDPAEASSTAFLQWGPQMGDSMAGAGQAYRYSKASVPPQLVTDPASGNQVWYDRSTGSMSPVRMPADQSAKMTLQEKTAKANFIRNTIKDFSNDPDTISLPMDEKIKKATQMWDELEGVDETSDSTDTSTNAPATSRFKIIAVQ